MMLCKPEKAHGVPEATPQWGGWRESVCLQLQKLFQNPGYLLSRNGGQGEKGTRRIGDPEKGTGGALRLIGFKQYKANIFFEKMTG
jgi:hypothetical protein